MLGLACLAVFIGACAPLTAYNALAPTDGGVDVVATDIAYGTDARQKLDVYVPEGAVAKKGRGDARPVVVVFYGGSWNSGRRQDYAFLGKALASRGFVAVVADYRLVPDVRFPAFLDDGALAVGWTYQNSGRFGGDPDKLYLFGHSAGAYNAMMLALDARYLTRAGLLPSIVKGVVALAGPFDFLPLDGDVTVATFGQADDLAATQPINFVSKAAPPMLLATGTDDTTVRPRNTLNLAEKLRAAGVAVTVRSYPGLSHIGILLAMSLPFRAHAPVLDDTAQFIAGRR